MSNDINYNKIRFWINHSSEIISLWSEQLQYANQLKNKFFIQKRYLGSKDKKIISETLFFYIRTAEFSKSLNSNELFLLAYNNVQKIKSSVNHFITNEDFNTYIYSQIENDNFLGVYDQLKHTSFFPQTYLHNINFDNEELENLCKALNQEATTDIRIISNREQIEKELIENEIQFYYNILDDCIKLEANINFQIYKTYKNRYFEIQDEASQLVSLILDPKPNENILDYCSGGGGKTLHIATLSNDLANITATDIDETRLRETQKRVVKHKLHSINIVDISQIDDSKVIFDKILIDAPCSGSGTVRRKPEMRYSINEYTLDKYTKLQLGILEKCWNKLKPGGELTYSTCSLFEQENDGVISNFLQSYNDITVVNLKDRMIKIGIGVDKMHFTEYGMATLPHRTQTDGFFICVLKKTV